MGGSPLEKRSDRDRETFHLGRVDMKEHMGTQLRLMQKKPGERLAEGRREDKKRSGTQRSTSMNHIGVTVGIPQ